MRRAGNWELLHLSSDPVPASGDDVRQVVRRLQDTFQAIEDVALRLARADPATWQGQSAASFGAQAMATAAQLDGVKQTYERAIGTLNDYAPKVDTARTSTWQALQRAKVADQELRATATPVHMSMPPTVAELNAESVRRLRRKVAKSERDAAHLKSSNAQHDLDAAASSASNHLDGWAVVAFGWLGRQLGDPAKWAKWAKNGWNGFDNWMLNKHYGTYRNRRGQALRPGATWAERWHDRMRRWWRLKHGEGGVARPYQRIAREAWKNNAWAKGARLASKTLGKGLPVVSAAMTAFDEWNSKDNQGKSTGYKVGATATKTATTAAGAWAGAWGGAAAGAAIGSIFPGPGTAIGAVVGGVVGGIAGSELGSRVGDAVKGFGGDAGNWVGDQVKKVHLPKISLPTPHFW